MQSDTSSTLFTIFTAATALGVLLQAGILLGMALGLLKMKKKIEGLLDEASVHLLPAIAASRKLVDELTPKIKVVSDNLVATTNVLRQEAEHIRVAVDDVVDKTRGQASRVDEMVTGTLNGVVHATTAIQDGISIPLRQIHGVLNGIRVGFDVLRKKSGTNHVREDEDLFV